MWHKSQKIPQKSKNTIWAKKYHTSQKKPQKSKNTTEFPKCHKNQKYLGVKNRHLGFEKKKNPILTWLLEWKVEFGFWVEKNRILEWKIEIFGFWAEEKYGFDLTFRFFRVKAEKNRFLGVNSRNLRRKIRFWLWVLRRKNQICWSEKSKFGFWEGKKCDLDLTFRIIGVKSWKNQISWSEKSKSEKRKPDFDLAPGVKSWIWVLRRKEQDFWSEKSKFGFWEEEKSDYDFTFRFLRVKSWKKTDFLEWKVEIWEEKSDFDFGFWEEKIRFVGVKNRNLDSEKEKNAI